MHETPNKLEFNRVDISKRMGLIVEQLKAMRKEVSEILKTLGSNQSAAPVIAHSRPNTISESIEPKLYGRDDILNNIVHSITQGEYCGKNLTVLSIVGHGGIGKTTLAQYIYQHQQVQTHFQVMVWKCVSFDFNVDKVTQDIKEHIPSIEDEKISTPREFFFEKHRYLYTYDHSPL
jgi:ABC-type multidrug transport system fused ATPase/permease subunit